MTSTFMNRTFLTIALAAWVASLPAAVRAEVKPNSLFSDGTVLQQGVAVPVWGTAKDGERSPSHSSGRQRPRPRKMAAG